MAYPQSVLQSRERDRHEISIDYFARISLRGFVIWGFSSCLGVFKWPLLKCSLSGGEDSVTDD